MKVLILSAQRYIRHSSRRTVNAHVTVEPRADAVSHLDACREAFELFLVGSGGLGKEAPGVGGALPSEYWNLFFPNLSGEGC